MRYGEKRSPVHSSHQTILNGGRRVSVVCFQCTAIDFVAVTSIIVTHLKLPSMNTEFIHISIKTQTSNFIIRSMSIVAASHHSEQTQTSMVLTLQWIWSCFVSLLKNFNSQYFLIGKKKVLNQQMCRTSINVRHKVHELLLQNAKKKRMNGSGRHG